MAEEKIALVQVEEQSELLQKGVVTYTKPPQNMIPPSQRTDKPAGEKVK